MSATGIDGGAVGGGGLGDQVGAGDQTPNQHLAHPTDLKELIMYLHQQAAHDEGIQSTILKVKSENSVSANVTAVNRAGKDEVKNTLAFLYGYETNNEWVAKFKKMGGAKMICHRIIFELAPKLCGSCNTIRFYDRDDHSRNKCLSCGCNACRNCHPDPIDQGKNIFYVCSECRPNVEATMGEGALTASEHLVAKPRKRTGQQIEVASQSVAVPTNDEVERVVEEEEEELEEAEEEEAERRRREVEEEEK